MTGNGSNGHSGTSGPELSGGDLLIGLAHAAAERGQPYASEFADFVIGALSDEQVLVAETVGQRPLKPHEATGISIVATAVMAAIDSGDRQAVQALLQDGLSLLARWSDYVAALGSDPG